MSELMSKLTAILRELPSLSPTELMTVRAAVDRLMIFEASPSGLYEALNTVLGVRVPFTKFKSMKAGRTYRKNEKTFIDFVKSTWPDATRTEQAVLYSYLLRLLVEHLRHLHITVNLTTMSNSLEYIPTVFDMAFPGYRESNLAFILKQAMVKQ